MAPAACAETVFIQRGTMRKMGRPKENGRTIKRKEFFRRNMSRKRSCQGPFTLEIPDELTPNLRKKAAA